MNRKSFVRKIDNEVGFDGNGVFGKSRLKGAILSIKFWVLILLGEHPQDNRKRTV